MMKKKIPYRVLANRESRAPLSARARARVCVCIRHIHCILYIHIIHLYYIYVFFFFFYFCPLPSFRIHHFRQLSLLNQLARRWFSFCARTAHYIYTRVYSTRARKRERPYIYCMCVYGTQKFYSGAGGKYSVMIE